MTRIPVESIKKKEELVPGDLRVLGNPWVRSSFRASGLACIPRETQVRQSSSEKNTCAASLIDLVLVGLDPFLMYSFGGVLGT